ncbi:MAG: signal peptide peptidase SppA [Holosporales bacterium]|jgi:protease-4|nr:signal peptide peptidase SppA [Holosporales bacterium]
MFSFKKCFRFIWTFFKRTIAFLHFIVRLSLKMAFYGLLLAGLAGGVFLYRNTRKDLPERGILNIAVEGAIPEEYTFSEQIISFFPGAFQQSLFGEHIEALWKAVRDPRIAGVFLSFSACGLTFTQAQELREVLLALRAHHKPVWVHANELDTKIYYCASSTTRILQPKEGLCSVTGFVISAPFVKEGLDKLGVDTFSLRRKEYKNFAEMFTDTESSAATKETYTNLLGILKEQLENALSRDGRIAGVRAFIDNAPYMAEEAQKLGAIDAMCSLNECRKQFKKSLTNSKNAVPHYIGVHRYLAAANKELSPAVAVIYLNGEITDLEVDTSGQSITSSMLASSLRQAGKDEKVKGIVLRINSPGGSLTRSGVLSSLITTARRKYNKPIVVSMGDVAASGGYWIAAPADFITANPATLTGSIGVVMALFSPTELMKKLGIAWEVFTTHQNAAIEASAQPLSEHAKARYAALIDASYALFIEHVARYRKCPIDQVENVAKGRIWTGAQAYTHHLVDKMGGLHTAVQEVCRLAKVPEADGTAWQHLTDSGGDPFKILQALITGKYKIFLPSLVRAFVLSYRPAHLEVKQKIIENVSCF